MCPRPRLLARAAQRGAVSDTSKTFVFEGEDHTLGNALRHILMRECVSSAIAAGAGAHRWPGLARPLSPSVQFCGYSVPHPQETKMNLRVQTTGKDANEALRNALNTFIDVCEHVDAVFHESVPEVGAEVQRGVETDADGAAA